MPATEQYWRPLGTVHKVFAGSALLLLLATLVMTAWDQNREWKRYQREAEDLKTQQLEAEKAGLESSGYLAELKRLKDAVTQAQSDLAAKAQEIAQFKAQLQELNGQVELRERKVKFKNAEVGVVRADRDIEVRDSAPAAQQGGTLQKYGTEEAEAREMAAELEAAKARREAVRRAGSTAGCGDRGAGCADEVPAGCAACQRPDRAVEAVGLAGLGEARHEALVDHRRIQSRDPHYPGLDSGPEAAVGDGEGRTV
jgi:hypothetical protein